MRKHRVYIGTPTTGIIRAEWVLARYGVRIPPSWECDIATRQLPSLAPIGFTVSDAQNVIAKAFLRTKCDWLLLIEHDNVLEPNAFEQFHRHICKSTVPIVSGLYFTKTRPGEPLIYRGRGNSYFQEFKLGDLVWRDGVPTGALLIHRSIIKYLWDNSAEYACGDPAQTTRQVFAQHQHVWFDPSRGWDNSQGTSDLEFSSRMVVDQIPAKAGWTKYRDMQYPLLVDTNILVGHIDNDGLMYPSPTEIEQWSLPHSERRDKRTSQLRKSSWRISA